MTELAWVLTTGSVVGGGVAVWCEGALARLEGPRGRRPDPGECACCRHDEVAHEHAGPGTACTQCPCDGFRPAC